VVNVLMADSLLDTQMAGPAGAEIAAVPAVRVGELLVYPRPVVRHDAGVEPVELVLDLRRWLISLPGSLSVPIVCASAQAAIAAAQAFRDAAESGAIGPSYSPAELAKWAAWWCARRSDAVEFRGGSR